jgi:hypothetical protein
MLLGSERRHPSFFDFVGDSDAAEAACFYLRVI